ncbi:esterase/lipase family protein [Nibricoccus sp. IMCC34717]|uniref:esterase/lipase family protein n=1 Tax=Nibricoccus sp. IMCC34717 TaxID=3034021 RepID=UPI00384B8463
MKIILVHGFLNRGGIFRKLKARLEAAGHVCHAPSLRPADARKGLPDLAGKLAGYIEAVRTPGEKFVLIGFSMGSILSRIYLQELGGAAHVSHFIAIAGPHQGTWSGWIYPSRGARQMRVGSPLLRGLNASVSSLSGIPVTCYWTRYDLMILPRHSCLLPGARVVEVPAWIHSLLLFDDRLIDDVIKSLS